MRIRVNGFHEKRLAGETVVSTLAVTGRGYWPPQTYLMESLRQWRSDAIEDVAFWCLLRMIVGVGLSGC